MIQIPVIEKVLPLKVDKAKNQVLWKNISGFWLWGERPILDCDRGQRDISLLDGLQRRREKRTNRRFRRFWNQVAKKYRNIVVASFWRRLLS